MERPFNIALPDGPGGIYVGTHRTDRAEDTRVNYLDQYTGAVLGDVGFAQYGSVGHAVDWSIAIHQGLEYLRAKRQPQANRDQVTFAPVDLLAAIVAMHPAALGGFRTLVVDEVRQG